MNLMDNLGCIVLAIFSALSVLIVQAFVIKRQYTWQSYAICLTQIFFVTSVVVYGYFYFIFKKISMAQFYPIIKIIELIIPVFASIFYYKAKLIPLNYLGIILAILAIICLEWE
jgi:drug/metabolite transporter (DMT)-like permease